MESATGRPLEQGRGRVPELLGRFPGRRVLVLGDAMLDRYIWGEVARISPEAPVPVVSVRSESLRLGGAANVAHNIRALGGEPILISLIGEDDGGRGLGRELEERGISAAHLVVDPDRPTVEKTRVIARNQQVVRIDREETRDVEGRVLDALAAQLAAALPRVEAIVISDYGKGVICAPLLEQWLPRFRTAGAPVCVDPKETHFHSYRRVTVLTPNLAEASFAAGRRIRDLASLDAVGRALREQLDAENLLITRGEEGMSLFPRGGPRLDIASVGREVYDVTGAGDTVVGTLALALAAGGTMEEATRLANHAAGHVIREVGTATVTREEILESWRTGGPALLGAERRNGS
jgi:D-beta-D-heptose 7-phosphate kinase/D-beta-D-heptose 1-phosphate adenosyltransferase